MLVLKINFSAIASVAHLQDLHINQVVGDEYQQWHKRRKQRRVTFRRPHAAEMIMDFQLIIWAKAFQ